MRERQDVACAVLSTPVKIVTGVMLGTLVIQCVFLALVMLMAQLEKSVKLEGDNVLANLTTLVTTATAVLPAFMDFQIVRVRNLGSYEFAVIGR